MKNKLILALLVNCFACIAYAQSYYFRNYQVNDGVSSNIITCIAQDVKGFMWFGTRNGLNRFDGTTFKIFKNDIKDSTSIGNNSIHCLYEDKNQKLWIGTSKGVFIYDALHEKFSLFTKLPQSDIRGISSDHDNNIWFVIGFSLFKLNTITNTIVSYSLAKTQIPILNITSNGTVWVGTDSGTIKRYDHSRNTFTDYIITRSAKKDVSVYIQALYPVNDTSLLIGTFKQVFLFNTKTLVSKNVFDNTPLSNNIQAHKIIYQSGSTYWIGTENGLYIIDLKTGKFEIIKKQYANPYSINDNVITDFCKDKEGNTWVGTFFGGINYYSKQLNQFQKYFPLPGVNSLSGNLVHEIISDKYGNLWVGTEDAGLNKIDKKTGIIKHFMPGSGSGRITYQNIHGLLADNNELWIGTYEHGLDVLDLTTEKVIRHYEKSEKPNSLDGNFIVTIYFQLLIVYMQGSDKNRWYIIIFVKGRWIKGYHSFFGTKI